MTSVFAGFFDYFFAGGRSGSHGGGVGGVCRGKKLGWRRAGKDQNAGNSCIFGCGQMQGRGVGWEMGSREADLSAAPLTRERSASVEMTVFGLDRTGTDNGKATAKAGVWGWLTVYTPPIAECAMDGAPGRFGRGEESRQRQVQGRGVGWEMVVVEKRISPLRRSQKRDRLRSK